MAASLQAQRHQTSSHPHFQLAVEHPEPPAIHEYVEDHEEFTIRLANTAGQRNSANVLIEKMYSWRGYQTTAPANEDHNKITLLIFKLGQSVGTISLNLDSESGLLLDELYKAEADELRRSGRQLSEVCKFAVDHVVNSKRLLATMFHIVFIYAYRIHDRTDFLIEVNPRHVAFYRRMLGFERLGVERTCARVAAPALLLRLKLEHMCRMIQTFGGCGCGVPGERSLYPNFFSPAEEAGITGRILAVHPLRQVTSINAGAYRTPPN
jgi:hypothetical protein